MTLEAIFYARFHPERGPTVIEQYPAGSIGPVCRSAQDEGTEEAGKGKSEALIHFSEISTYIIPPYELCGRSLSVCVAGERGRYRILGWPISLENEAYARNRFTFNVCYVVREHAGGHASRASQVSSWERVVRKTALFFRALEVEDGILAAEEDSQGSQESESVLNALLRQTFEQLNTYREACVRVDKIHVLNLRLENTTSKSPPKVKDWQVPLLIRSLPSQKEWTWDLTLAKIAPHIDGINHIARIAERADVEAKLVRHAVRGLIFHERVRLLDIFHFQAIYTLTPDFTYFVQDTAMQEECQRYISGPASDQKPTTKHVLALYAALTSTNQSVQDFVLTNQSSLLHNISIDIRRFITFGVLKDFLRRVHKYALLMTAPSSTSQGKISGSGSGNSGGMGSKRSNEEAAREFDRAWRKAALSSGWETPPFEVGSLEVPGLSPEKGREVGSVGSEKREQAEVQEEADEEDEKLKAFLDGKHCLDEVCVALKSSERKLMERLRGLGSRRGDGEVVVFCK